MKYMCNVTHAAMNARGYVMSWYPANQALLLGPRSWSGYGPWLCCNHALIEGWSEYDAEACSHCRHRRAQVNPYTGMPKIVKGVPTRATRPTGGWTHGKGKAKKRLLLHSKRLQPQTAVSAAMACALLRLHSRHLIAIRA